MTNFPAPHALLQPPKRRPAGLAAVITLFVSAALLGVLGFWVSMPLAGILFVIWIITIAATRTELAFAFMLASAPFVWDLGGGPVKLAASELALVLALPALLLARRARPIASPVWPPIAAYLLICIVSLLISGEIGPSITSMLQMVVYLVIAVFVFSSCVRDARELYPAFYAMLGSNLILVVAELVTRSNYVLGLHKNGIGTQLACAVIVATELALAATEQKQRRILWAALAALSVGLILTLSRGAWTGTGTALFLMFALRGRLKASLKVLVAIAPIVVVAWLMLPAESRDYATDFNAGATNIKARWESIDFAMGYFKSSPVIGVGVGLRKIYDATNLIMSTLAETGVLGLIAFLSIFCTLLWMAWRASRKLRADDSTRSLLIIGIGLVTCKFVHGLVDHYWSRGMLPAWAGAGMVAYAYRRSRTNPHALFRRIKRRAGHSSPNDPRAIVETR
jgi:O-antigen ligase